MKIAAIKNNFKAFISKHVLQSRTNPSSLNPLKAEVLQLSKIPLERTPKTDIFQKQKSLQQPINTTSWFLDPIPFNEEKYANLSDNELLKIRANLSSDLINDTKALVSSSKIIKTLFDKKFGEGMYTFVSVGRSLSAMAKCLEVMGVETKQIPFSGCGKEKIKNIVNTMVEENGFENYKNFLEKNLEKKENHKYIFCDYIYTGRSLKAFKTFLKHPDVDLHSRKSEYIGINKFLSKKGTKNKEDIKTIKIFNNLLYEQRLDKYAEIKSLNFSELENLNTSLEPTWRAENNLIRFCTLDMLKNPKVYE